MDGESSNSNTSVNHVCLRVSVRCFFVSAEMREHRNEELTLQANGAPELPGSPVSCV